MDKDIETVLTQYQRMWGDIATPPLSTEAMFQKMSEHYQDIINCMPGNVYWVDTQCVLQGCNQNVLNMIGYESMAPLRGLNYREIGPMLGWSAEATNSFTSDTFDVITSGKAKLNVEEPPIYHVNGQVMYFLTSRVPLFDQQGKVICVVGVSIDITERKLIDQALLEAKQTELANRAKQEFLNNIRHDIRTPFSGLLGMSRLLEETEPDPIKKERLQWIADGAQSLLDYLNELVGFIELESSDRPVLQESFNIRHLLSDAYALFLTSAQLKQIDLIWQDDDESMPSYLCGDKYRIQRVLINLLGNAVKFTAIGAVEFGVKLHSQEGKPLQLMMWVKDTGMGIPADKYSFIFEKFTRLHSTSEGVYKGIGLGLRAVKQIMSELKGEVIIDSVLGQGSTFYCLLPFKTMD